MARPSDYEVINCDPGMFTEEEQVHLDRALKSAAAESWCVGSVAAFTYPRSPREWKRGA